MKILLIGIAATFCSFAPFASSSNQPSVTETNNVEMVSAEASAPVQLTGPIRWARPCNTKDGWISLRQFPNAKSRCLCRLYEWDDEFRVRKVRGTNFYAVLYSNSNGIRGYVNGNYICFY